MTLTLLSELQPQRLNDSFSLLALALAVWTYVGSSLYKLLVEVTRADDVITDEIMYG